jgi:hypothetical protein
MTRLTALGLRTYETAALHDRTLPERNGPVHALGLERTRHRDHPCIAGSLSGDGDITANGDAGADDPEFHEFTGQAVRSKSLSHTAKIESYARGNRDAPPFVIHDDTARGRYRFSAATGCRDLDSSQLREGAVVSGALERVERRGVEPTVGGPPETDRGIDCLAEERTRRLGRAGVAGIE